MRLINTSTLELQDFSLSIIPPYAILSHTWGDGEVSFQEMSLPDRSLKEGYSKITQTCQLALEHNLGFAWVDTCCIDKASSAELTESINSMFQWYMNAVVCYVYLKDLSPTVPIEGALAHCRWFTRGWTLQELLAPKKVEFYDVAWNYRGSKLGFINTISDSTGIPRNVLRGDRAVVNCSVARRMSWAARRQTTRVEDIAYCLLGIFDVNMPLLYGEGLKAFRRLQEEIVKRKNDLTIFAWENSQSQEREEFLGLFATSPASFVDSSAVTPFSDDFINFSVTNKGLLFSGDVPLRTAVVITEDGREVLRYLILLGISSADGGIYLRKVGPGIFYRDGKLPLAGFGANKVMQIGLFDATDYYILVDLMAINTISLSTFRNCAVHVSLDDIFQIDDAVPGNLWDFTDRVFLRPKPYSWTRYPMVIAMSFHGTLEGKEVHLIVLCDYRKEVPVCKLFRHGQHLRQEAMIFQGRNRNNSIYWVDLEIEVPDILLLTNFVDVRAGKQTFRVSVFFKKGIVEDVSKEVELFSLKFAVSMSR